METTDGAEFVMPAASKSFSAKQVSEVLDGLVDPALVIGPDLTILGVNPLFLDHCSNGACVVGRRCYEVTHRFKRPCNEMGEHCPILDCRKSGEPCRAVHVHHNCHGLEHEEITAYPLTDGAGETGAFLEVTRRLTVASTKASSSRLAGRSPAFNRMLAMAQQAAPKRTAVLLLGETGTGKELLARAIHELSDRADKPFVAVDCSGISETLFESELFGHERGAFTGAVSQKMGLVESVAGGTLFLDEVGDISPPQQVKLLRLLETRTFRRVGSVDVRRADFRLICATHRQLKDQVADGSFRADLYHRISAFPIAVPPLRERMEDLQLLAESALKQAGCQANKKFHSDTLELLLRYDFPGNIRELRNIAERACMLAVGDVILPDHLPGECKSTNGTPAPTSHLPEEIVPLSEAERRYLAWAVQSFSGDNRELAARLGLSERTFYRKLKTLQSNDTPPDRASSMATAAPRRGPQD